MGEERGRRKGEEGKEKKEREEERGRRERKKNERKRGKAVSEKDKWGNVSPAYQWLISTTFPAANFALFCTIGINLISKRTVCLPEMQKEANSHITTLKSARLSGRFGSSYVLWDLAVALFEFPGKRKRFLRWKGQNETKIPIGIFLVV